MATDHYTADESRKLAVLIARIWANPQLASEYQRDPTAVLGGAGVNLAGRAVPEIPEKPAELAAQAVVRGGVSSSASSASTITCPCTGCTASCACCNESVKVLGPDSATLLKLADSPEARAQARKLTSSWGLNVTITQ
jgi:hypothetical protein